MNALASWMTLTKQGDDTVAQKVGVSRVQISRIRRGLSKPSPDLAAKLEAISGVPAWDFVRPAEPGEPQEAAA